MTIAALVSFLCSTSALRTQQPTVSPAVDRLLQQDTVVAVWLFARPEILLSEVEQLVAESGGRVRRTSRWVHAVSAQVNASAVAVIRRSTAIRHVQPVAVMIAPLLPRGEVGMPRAAAAEGQATQFGPSAMPFRRLNLFPLTNRGYRGSGIRIALLDTGFETDLPAFDSVRARVIGTRDFVGDSLAPDSVVRNEPTDVANASQHGTAVWSLLAANVPDTMVGIAPEAEYILAKTEDVRSERRVEEDNYVAALEWADSLGARVISSSLGYLRFDDGFAYTSAQLNGDVAVTTVAADIAAARGITVVVSAGNSGQQGPRSLGTPADGDSVIAVGAEDSLGTLAGFSSRGPTADGRIKPDLTAPGVAVFVVNTESASGYSRFNGTSFSAPIVAGAAVLLREIHPTMSGVDVRDALRIAGSNAASPDSNVGWGRPNALVAATFPRGIVLSSPTDTILSSVTPTFSWSTPDVPSFGLPVSYRFTLTRLEDGNGTMLVDTTLTQTSVILPTPQRPGTRFSFTLEANAADTATVQLRPAAAYVTPAWATLLTLDDPAGLAIRERRPVLRWSSPTVASPPGPFTYDVEIFRSDDDAMELRATDLDTTAFVPGTDLDLNTPYRWRVVSRLGNDTAITESRGAFLIVDESIPTVTLLFQNFPNPFPNPTIGRPTTCIWFDLARAGRVRLEILDLRGHLVRRLIPGATYAETLPAGRYGRPAVGTSGQCDRDLEWDGLAGNGEAPPRGVYIVKLETPDGVFFKRVVFLGER